MAYATTAHHSARLPALFAPLANAVAAVQNAWARSRIYARTYAELNALSTRELNDLGISRSMITRLAHEAAYGRDA